MSPEEQTSGGREQKLLAERHRQVGAALLLGAGALLWVVFRAGVRNVFPPGWWRL